MFYYQFSAIVNALSLTGLGIVSLTRGPKANINFALVALSFSSALWSYFYFLWQISDSYTSALFSCRMLLLGVFFIPSTWFHFVTQLIEKKYNRFVFIGYISSVIFASLSFTPLLIKDLRPRLFFNYWPTAGSAFIWFMLIYIALVVPSFILLYQKHKTASGFQKIQLKILFWGALTGFIGGTTNFPLWYDIPLPPIGNILVSIFAIAVSYVMIKYQFMDIQIFVKRSLAYTLLITALTIFYLIFIYVIERYLQNAVGYKSLSVSLIFASLIAIIFTPLKNKIQHFIDRLFYQGTNDEIAQQNELLRREVIQAEKLKAVATLASGMAHEIKNPLTAIQTFTEYLPQKQHDPEFLNKFSTIVGKEVNRINDLVHQLLDFAKPTPSIFTELDIHAILDDITTFLSNEFVKKNISFLREYTAEQVIIPGDHNKLKQAFLNILLNALQACAEGGQIIIRTYNSNNSIEISIQDTGQGIAAKDLPYIFDPFFTRKENGTGLGLSITQGIVQEQGGMISVNSEIGRGATFLIQFPLKTQKILGR